MEEIFQVSIRAEQLQETIRAFPTFVRWAGWAKAVLANKLRNLEAEESHCLSVLGNLTVMSHGIFSNVPLGISGLMHYAELIQSLCSVSECIILLYLV